MGQFSATKEEAPTRTTVDVIREGLGVLVEPGATVELRALANGRAPVSGYFVDLDRLAAAAARLVARNEFTGIYYTINPVTPGLLARADHRVDRLKATTADRDIIRRTRFLVD